MSILRESDIPSDIYVKFAGKSPKATVEGIPGKNLPAWSLKNLMLQLNKAYNNKDRALMVLGGGGIGKSSVMLQFAQHAAKLENREFMKLSDFKDDERWEAIENPSKYYIFIDLRAGELNPEQAQGIPDVEFGRKKGYLRFLPPDWQALITNQRFSGMIFLDEINRGSEQVINSLFQFVLDRVAAGKRISKNAMIVAAGNLAIDGSVSGTVQLDAPLMSRFDNGVLVLQPEEWAAHARKIGVSKYIIDFALSKPDENLFGKGAEIAEHNIPINPRQLVAASSSLKFVTNAYLEHTKTGDPIPDYFSGEIYEDIRIALSGSVGSVWIDKFIEWLEIVHQFDWATLEDKAKQGHFRSQTGIASKNEFDTSKKWALTNFIIDKVLVDFDDARKANDEAKMNSLYTKVANIFANIDPDNVSLVINSLSNAIRDDNTIDGEVAAQNFAMLMRGIALVLKKQNSPYFTKFVNLTKDMKGASNR